MIGFQAPLWLLLLGLIPLIRWLHRFRRQSQTLPSTTLFLWVRLQPDSARHGDLDKPDPRWILRAVIYSLLILALAEPQLHRTQETPLEVWVDDSLSMFTRESGQTRLRAGLQQLRAYLDDHEFSQIQLHSLGKPGLTLALDPQDSSRWQAQLNAWSSQHRAEPAPPLAVALSKQSRNILITDGADHRLNRWAQSAALTLIIKSAELRQNLALSRLNIRDPLTDSAAVTGTVRIDNPGDRSHGARLVIRQQQDIIKTVELNIPAQGFSITSFELASAGQASLLQAQLHSDTDPLPLDNSLELDRAGLQPRLGYALQGDCEPRFMAVIDSHPALVEAGTRAELLINCSAQALDSTLPTLWLHPVQGARRTTQSAHWHQQLTAGYLPLAAGLAYSDAAPVLTSAGAPLLSANDRLLLGQRPGARKHIDSYLDSGDSEFSRTPAYPLLYLELIGYLSGHSLELPPLSVNRDIEASRISPLPLAIAAASATRPAPAVTLFSKPILFAICLLLLLDAALWLRLAAGRLNWQS